MGIEPGADELIIRDILRWNGVGPDAQHDPAVPRVEPTPEPEPAADPDGWWDDLYADQPRPAEEPTPEPQRRRAPRLPDWWRDKPEDLTTDEDDTAPDDEDEQPTSTDTDPDESAPEDPTPEPTPARRPRHRPFNRRPAYNHPAPPSSPRQSLLDAYDRIPPRIKWLGYHATAAYAGWELGLVDYSMHVTAWIASTGLVGPQAFFWYGVAAATGLLYRRFARAPRPIAWAAAVPVSSIVVGVLLYAPHP